MSEAEESSEDFYLLYFAWVCKPSLKTHHKVLEKGDKSEYGIAYNTLLQVLFLYSGFSSFTRVTQRQLPNAIL